MPKLVWRVKLVAELRAGVISEVEVARLERDERAGLAECRPGKHGGGRPPRRRTVSPAGARCPRLRPQPVAEAEHEGVMSSISFSDPPPSARSAVAIAFGRHKPDGTTHTEEGTDPHWR